MDTSVTSDTSVANLAADLDEAALDSIDVATRRPFLSKSSGGFKANSRPWGRLRARATVVRWTWIR